MSSCDPHHRHDRYEGGLERKSCELRVGEFLANFTPARPLVSPLASGLIGLSCDPRHRSS